ncbi:uncharacterized protein DNG_00101 [Cephalotrichum gorgonifer]|uniref:N-acetyltransferase domain-containing protein n=1 Tax=Cephalotrichum gorgonifer TaxID=2041049 RepID=A0AAE8MQM0_9PEZI|nr:uncharacterized protein DNG_00101 [Cephalotrichum gorgonifer]
MTDPNFAIDTPRLRISHFQPDNDAHCDFLVELYNSPALGPSPITTREKARERLAGRVRDEHARNGYGAYLVSLKEQAQAGERETLTLTPVGTVSLMRGEEPNCYAVPDLGFALMPAYFRRGYATEAAKALMEYAARELGLGGRVLGLTDPANEAARGVFRKLGFEDRGERVLTVFGGVVGSVWTAPGMDGDLAIYGL